MNVMLDIKPFESISDAIDGLEVAFEHQRSLKFTPEDFSSFEQGRLVKLITACKSLLTIEQRFNEFLKYYHIDYIPKVFWENTTWFAEVVDFRSKIKVYSGTPHYYYNKGKRCENFTNLHDANPHCAETMISQMHSYLIKAQNKWSNKDFNGAYNREVHIASQAKRINKYAPFGDYYGIYEG